MDDDLGICLITSVDNILKFLESKKLEVYTTIFNEWEQLTEYKIVDKEENKPK